MLSSPIHDIGTTTEHNFFQARKLPFLSFWQSSKSPVDLLLVIPSHPIHTVPGHTRKSYWWRLRLAMKRKGDQVGTLRYQRILKR